MARKLRRLPKSFPTAAEFAAYLAEVDQYREKWGGQPLVLGETYLTKAHGSPLVQPGAPGGFRVGMSGATIAAMEGWDSARNGRPTPCNIRRWQRMGASGAKIIFGGEACAVDAAAKANPNQLSWNEHWIEYDLAVLAQTLRLAHCAHFGGMQAADDLLLLLQLTHSGRWCVPTWESGRKPRLMRHHPVLNDMFKLGTDSSLLMTDDELRELPAKYARLALAAQKAGFNGVDVKCCHGYHGYEALSAFTRPGDYGGSFENRTRFFRDCVAAIRDAAPELIIAVRFSAWDIPPKLEGVTYNPAEFHFGVNADGEVDLTEAVQFMRMCVGLGITIFHITGGCPYYSASWQRPAYAEAVDMRELQPGEVDPMAAMMLHIRTAEYLRKKVPEAFVIASGLTAAHKYLPHLSEALVADAFAHSVSIGRGCFAYHDFFSDMLGLRCSHGAQAGIDEKRLCVGCSGCTNLVRKGYPCSGCTSFDPAYRPLPVHALALEQARAET